MTVVCGARLRKIFVSKIMAYRERFCWWKVEKRYEMMTMGVTSVPIKKMGYDNSLMARLKKLADI